MDNNMDITVEGSGIQYFLQNVSKGHGFPIRGYSR